MIAVKMLWLNWRCWLNPAMGGAEVFTYEVAKRWVASGHDVTLFTAKFPGSKTEETVDGIKIVRAGGRFTVYGKAKRFCSDRFMNKGFDVIIDEINTRPFFASKFAKKDQKVIALIHQLAREFWFYETPFPVSYMGHYFLENRWLAQYRNVPTVTVSQSTYDDLVALGFRNVSIVSEGLNFEPLKELSLKNPKPIIVFSGRLKRAKRPDHAIKAFKIVKDKIPNSELWIFGDGPFRKRLEHSSSSGVRFFGQLSTNERRQLLSQSWILVVPGVREGWGLNVIEANALGVPTVAYNVPGLKDSVKNQDTGLLVENGNIQALAENLITLLEDGNKRQILSLNALKYAKEFNWDKTANEFIAKINSL